MTSTHKAKDCVVQLTTSLKGRVRNTSLPKSNALLPLMEAVVNGIQAIDARPGANLPVGHLTITINRTPQDTLSLEPAGPGRTALSPITGFTVEDNGVGFTDENMTSFQTLDSSYKADLGGRGVGRLLWLKAFNRVKVTSVYTAGGEECRRAFRFTETHGVETLNPLTGDEGQGTRVSLEGFKEEYQLSAPKGGQAIARDVFHHCIWYFLRDGGAPDIELVDVDERVMLNAMLEEFSNRGLQRTCIDVKGQQFDLVGLRLVSASRSVVPRLHWCAASRVVKEETLTGKIPGLFGRMQDDDGTEFTYACFLSSDYLDQHVRADRTAFDLGEEPSDLHIDIALGDIRAKVFEQIAQDLASPLATARQQSQEKVNDFVSQKAPRYRPTMSHFTKSGRTVDPSISDTELELVLHKSQQDLEFEVMREGQEVFVNITPDQVDDYGEQLATYIDKVTDLNRADLAGYVARRKVILKVLEKLIGLQDDGKFSREERVHNLIFPMKKESNEVAPDGSNLWILDERLAFHDYLASDLPFSKMSPFESDSATRPDILATRLAVDSPVLASNGEPYPLASIVVVEFKRPMRGDIETGHNPIEQCLEYVERVRAGKVRSAQTGRAIPQSADAPAFCYIVADLTEKMHQRCRWHDLSPTHDGLGYFGYIKGSKAYVEVLSFDQLVIRANERNRAFFDKLGLPAR